MKFWWPRRREAELDLEVRHHLRLATEARRERGESSDNAEAGARREFGNVELVKETSRDIWGFRHVEEFLEDLRFGLRMLAKNPGFTAIAVLTLAIGIGANTAVFSIVDWAILRPLPIAEPGQVVYLGFPQGADNRDPQFSVGELREIRDGSKNTFSDVAGLVFGAQEGGLSSANGLTVNGETQPVQAVFVSGGFFPMLGIQPYLGRFLRPEEGWAAGADPVVVLSYNYWHKRFGGDASIVGRKATMNGQPVTIVGIGPKGFLGVTPIIEMEAYLPLGMLTVQTEHVAEHMADPHWRWMAVIARLRPGVNISQAQDALRSLGEEIFRETPRINAKNSLELIPLRPPGMVSGTNPFPKLSALFLTLAGLVLAIACVNVVNLVLVRGSARQREIAVRAALGASRSRLVRQLLTESLLLGLLGCAGGVLTGYFASRALSAIPTQSEMPFALDFPFDWQVFAYALAVALASSTLVSLYPALRLSRGNVNATLHAGGRTQTEGKSRLRSALVVIQVGGSLALLIAAGLFTRSLLNARQAQLGFEPEGVANLSLDPHEIGYDIEHGLAFYKELLARIRATPGVESASLITTVPLSDNLLSDDILGTHVETRQGQEPPHSSEAIISPGYFHTMRMAMRQGRDFSDSDTEKAPRVAVINEAMAEKFWPGKDPVGQSFRRGSDPSQAVQVIGVVNNSRTDALYGPYSPMFYVPLAQNYGSYATLQIRSAGPWQAIIPPAIDLVHSLAPAMPITGVRSMMQALHGINGLFLFDLGAAFAAALGAMGLLLAVVGIYGVMSYATSMRTQEIGVRMAFGARPKEIFLLISRQGFLIITAGIACGLLAMLLVAFLIGDFLVGISPSDPLTYSVVSLLLAAVSLAAALIPAARATKLEPVAALRHE
jgi:predicted permease